MMQTMAKAHMAEWEVTLDPAHLTEVHCMRVWLQSHSFPA